MHEATGTFDIGNPNLKIEVAKSVEAGLRRAVGPFRFEATAYYTRFYDFIFRQLTGETCEGEFAELHAGRARRRAESGGLVAARCDLPRRRDPGAVRRGAAVDRDVRHRGPIRLRARHLHRRLERAAHSAGARMAAACSGATHNWLARVCLLHAFAQNDIADERDADRRLRSAQGRALLPQEARSGCAIGLSEIAFGIFGNNLLNDDVRNLGLVQEGRGPAARPQLQVLRQCEVLISLRELAT